MMKTLIVLLFTDLFLDFTVAWRSSCGIEKVPVSFVYDGLHPIHNFPWMGMLYYPLQKKRFTTAVVLVTRQIVIASAGEIDKLPKTYFRLNARVVLGRGCGAGGEARVRDYTYHPEYARDTASALAMLQLETDHLQIELRPICQPPSYYIQPQFFALTIIGNCRKPRVRVHRMQYVDINKCKTFYRRSGLDQSSLWPAHTACARAVSGGRCVWRSGSVLAVKQNNRWKLLGFSIYGPGCGDPARFLDYGMYHRWVRLSSSAVGSPAITRMGDNHLIMRRSLANIQRYGACDPEERIAELYSDRVTVLTGPGRFHTKYNVSILSNVEYSCVTFEARPLSPQDYRELQQRPQSLQFRDSIVKPLPKIRLRRWCAKATAMCYGFQHLEVKFYVDITFSQSINFDVHVYGTESKIISAYSSMKYANVVSPASKDTPQYDDVLKLVIDQQDKSEYKWFYQKDVGN